jgi:hypothetical protein
MRQKPAPDSLLEFLACGCKKSKCQNNMRICVANGLNCTDLCNCNTCANGLPDEDDLTRNEVFDMDDDTDD